MKTLSSTGFGKSDIWEMYFNKFDLSESEKLSKISHNTRMGQLKPSTLSSVYLML